MTQQNEPISMYPDNPYRPATDGDYVPSAFAGRAGAYSQINQHLTTANTRQAAAFIGRRHIGKSALLWHFREFFTEPYVGVYIPLRRLAGSLRMEVDVLGALTSYMRMTLADHQITTERLPETGDMLPISREWFQDAFLPAVFREVRRQQIVLLLDDVHVLLERIEAGDFSTDLFVYLSDLLGMYSELGMVITLDNAYASAVGRLAPLTDIDQIHRLDDLPLDETLLLLRIPEEYRVEDDAAETAQAATGGQPLLLQRLGYHLYERALANQKRVITRDDVRQVIPEVALESHQEFREGWLALPLNERLVLTAVSACLYAEPLQAVTVPQIQKWLVETDYPLDTTTIRSAIRGLEYAHLITHQAEGVIMNAGILQTWLLQNAKLDMGQNGGGRGIRWWEGVIILVVVAALIAAVLMVNQWERVPTISNDTQPTVTLEAR